MGQSQSSDPPRQSKAAVPKFNPKITVQWEFQSSEKQQWIPYEPVDNYLLEKAYRNQQEKVDLGESIVILKGSEMVQHKKNDASVQSNVRRNEEYFRADEESKVNREEENARKNRFFGAETPKTYTKTLACLEQFLVFFENRGPEIQNFVNLFKEIEFTQDLNKLNQEIVPLLINSLRAEVTQSKRNQGEKEILDLFQKEFTSFKQFYGDVLKTYSINGFLSTNINQYLRNEDWIGLDCLLPYAFCLCKAFVWHNSSDNQVDNGQNEKITLYRGAQFDETALRFYDSQAVPTFSWNGVTSASTDRKAAEQSMYNEIDSKKTPVMFIIEVPMSPEELKNSNWINIKPFTVYPEQDEFILNPGSIFKMTRYRRDHKGVEMTLRLVVEVSPLAIEEQIMLAAIQAEMARNKVAKLEKLEKKELEEAITYLKGNKLFDGLELNSCKFDSKTLAKLQATLSALPNLKSLVCVSLESKEEKHLDAILQLQNKERIRNLEIRDELKEYRDNLPLLWKRIKGFTSLTSLTLNFTPFRQIKDENFIDFGSEVLTQLTSLRTLDLNFAGSYYLSDLSLANFSSHGLRHLTSLTSLTLSFAYCNPLTDTGLASLWEGLRHMTSLTSLSLNFEHDNQITDEALVKLYSEGLRHLTSLATLSLHLEYTCGLQEEGLSNFLSEIKPMSSLRNVTIYCHLLSMMSFNMKEPFKTLVAEAEEKGVSIILKGFKDSILEQSVWHFKRYIKDEDTNPEEDIVLSTENAVSLNSADELEEFYSKGIEYSQNLKSLALKCSAFKEDMNDEKITTFCTQTIKQATSLTALNLDFGECKQIKITDEFLSDFCSEGLRHLTSLKTLTLDFANCYSITDIGLTSLGKALRNLTSLTTLSLGFVFCGSQLGKGLNYICYEGLRHLPSLTTLSLNCGYSGLTDEDLRSLCCEGIRHLTTIRVLNLDFKTCMSVHSEALRDVALLIKYFGYRE